VPSPNDIITQGFARRTKLSPEQELAFQEAFKPLAAAGHNADDPTYDSRAAWLAGKLPKVGEHGLSQFKGLGDDRLFLPIGPNGQMLDTRTAQGPDAQGGFTGPTPNPQLLALWRLVSAVMNKGQKGK
jgi:hypothetical protein